MKLTLKPAKYPLVSPFDSWGNRLLEAVVIGIAIGGTIFVTLYAGASMESDRLEVEAWNLQVDNLMVERNLQSNGWSSGHDYRSFDWSGYDEDDFPVEVRLQIQADRARLDAKGGR